VTVVDPETGELVGRASAVQALLDGDETVDDPALAAALSAARDPAFRVATIGVAPAATVLGDAAICVLMTDRPHDRRGLFALASEQAPVALAAWLGLGPRPVPDEPAIRLEPGTMAVLIGRGQAHGHGLDPDLATALQRRLDSGVRHWTVRVECPAWRRNLEVLEGDGGIWRVRPADGLVELAPTTTTAVVRELVALCESARRGNRPAAP
jgi:hypothetical protein